MNLTPIQPCLLVRPPRGNQIRLQKKAWKRIVTGPTSRTDLLSANWKMQGTSLKTLIYDSALIKLRFIKVTPVRQDRIIGVESYGYSVRFNFVMTNNKKRGAPPTLWFCTDRRMVPRALEFFQQRRLRYKTAFFSCARYPPISRYPPFSVSAETSQFPLALIAFRKMRFYIAALTLLVFCRWVRAHVRYPAMKQNPRGVVMESTLRPKNPVKRRQLLLASGVHKREINYRDDGKMACPFLMTCCIMTNGNPICNTDCGYCLIPSAVCCSDGIHCCPAGYRCGTTKCYRGHKPFFPETMGFHKILVTDLGQNPWVYIFVS